MKESIYRVIIAIGLSLSSFFVAQYFLNYFMFEARDVKIKLHLNKCNEGKLLAVYDFVSAANDWNEGVIQVFDTTQSILLDIPNDIRVKNLFLLSQDSVKLVVDSVEVINLPGNFSYGVSDLKNMLYQSYFYRTPPTEIKAQHGNYEISLLRTAACLQIRTSFFDNLYPKINKPIWWGACTVAILVLIFSFVYGIRKLNLELSFKSIFFLTFILLLTIGFFSPKQNSTDENRALIPFPNLKVNIWKIPAKYTAYYNDHFPYRSEISKASSNFKVKVLGTSPNPDAVRIGQDGWLFASEPFVRRVSRGKDLFSLDEMKLIQKNLEKLTKISNKLGAKFYLFLPPLKHSIYPEKLPSSMSRGEYNKLMQLTEYLSLNSSVNMINVYPTLMNKKDSVDVFYQSDIHWNQLGGFFAYQKLIKELNNSYPNIGAPKTLQDYSISESRQFNGDLVQRLNIYDKFSRKVYSMQPSYQKQAGPQLIEVPKYKEAKYSSFNSPKLSEKPRLLMYRDSYNEYMFNHIAEHFSYYGMAWTRTISFERIKEVEPDIVVFEMMERFVDHLKEDELLMQ